VAQAPIVTRNLDAARTRRMRSPPAGVVIEPSTRDRSYGPSMTSLDASPKEAMVSEPAIASRSSSQLSSVS